MKQINLKKITMNILGGTQASRKVTRLDTTAHIPSLSIDQLSTCVNLKAISKNLLGPEPAIESDQIAQDSLPISDMPTLSLPIIPEDYATNPLPAVVTGTESQITMLRKLVKSSGIYAFASMASPLVTLALAPFLTRHLSPSDYGVLTILNSFISLAAGITQLGLGSAFFRAYSYDFTSSKDRRDIIATVTTLLFLASISAVIGMAIIAPFLAHILLGRSSFGNLIILAAGVILLQNLGVPGFAWLRAENRPVFYSFLAIGNLLIALIATIVLIGTFNLGIAGSLIATGGGYICVVIGVLPLILLRSGIKLRADIARGLLAYGVPLVLNVVSYWALQVLDRYLVSLFGSLAQAAEYGVAYSLGSALFIVVIAPFGLAWPTTMFAIAKRKDAAQSFKIFFRWFSLFLLFAAFGLSLVGIILLDWLFPLTYHSAAPVIPIVAESLVFFGIYYVFALGVNIKRKTWLIGVFSTIAAIVNLALNLVLIPRFGLLGAALATLLGYIVLASAAYIVNQRLYPVPFEIGKFIVALFLGMALYAGSNFLAQSRSTYIAWSISFGTLILYGGCLVLIGILPTWGRKQKA